MDFISAFNFRGNMVFYQQIITLKTIMSWKNKNGNGFVSIRWRAKWPNWKKIPVQLSPSSSYPGLQVQL